MYIFVYGTLMTGYNNNHLLSTGKLIAKAKTSEKYVMYTMGHGEDYNGGKGVPFVNNSDHISQIYGELWEIDNSVISSIDELEGAPNWYSRQTIDIDDLSDVSNNQLIRADIYMNFNVVPEKYGNMMKLVESGNFDDL